MDPVRSFLKGLSADSIEYYFRKRGIEFEIDRKGSKKACLDRLMDLYENNLTEEQRNTLDWEFQEMKRLTSKDAIQLLLEKAKIDKIEFPEEQVENWSQYDKALWFYLNRKDFFEEALVLYQAENNSGWKEVYFPPRPLEYLDGKHDKLSKALHDYLTANELKGMNCEVHVYIKDNRAFYIAHPDGHAQRNHIYKNNKLTYDEVKKPVEKIFFIYDPKTGGLSVKAKGRTGKIDKLHEIFGTVVLDRPWTTAHKKVLNLTMLKDPDCSLGASPDFLIDHVYVKGLTLFYMGTKNRITYEISDYSQQGVYDMHQFINNNGGQLTNPGISIIHAKIKINFKSEAFKGKQGRRTIELSGKNRHNLSYNALDNTVKQLLIEWKLLVQAHEKSSANN